MTPLLDVILLLLTFFIYSVAMMVRADVLPVQLTPLAAGQPARGAGALQVITVDHKGELFWNREPLSSEALDTRLRQMGSDPTHPAVYLAMEAGGDKDRGPVLLRLIEQVRAAGVGNFVLVGQPGESRAGSTPVPTPPSPSTSPPTPKP